MTTTPSLPETDEPTARQQAVLDAVLSLIVEEGDQLTMTAVARSASCSKETLYKWFGDRDGLLTATVRWQAARVRAGRYDRPTLDIATLRDWLTLVMSSSLTSLPSTQQGMSGCCWAWLLKPPESHICCRPSRYVI